MFSMSSHLRLLPLRKPLPSRMLIMSALMSSVVLTGCSPSNSETPGGETGSIEQMKEDILGVLTPEASLESEIEQPAEPVKQFKPNVSQQFIGETESQLRLAKAFQEVPYSLDALPEKAQQVNSAQWTPDAILDENLIIKIQGLLNYNHHSVGAVDGRFGENVIKALQVFQERNGLEADGQMTPETWAKLTEDETVTSQPVLVNYDLTKEDVTLISHPKGQQFTSVLEAVAEKFHMSQGLLLRLNPETPFEEGNTILVYNPYQPNEQEVHRVVAVKAKNLLYAYNDKDELVASYPTTMGSVYKPSPEGEYKVLSRIKDPTYNKDFSNENSVLPPGPNNPVGRVWIGINKPSYGIHGSPNPERISRQNSSGCVRLTNWDALGLYGTIEEGAKVEFL
ncbi:L,D-transpeptidase family protein [Psychrobacter sp. UBA3962]|uniref:L,D-transpeptidase family protein n=1 Tax=Psychrobacter sp. UBA3962 TaxID=1947352 RepID=UPI0025CE4D2D|nr:L,D-transpeptidase family protein [Psychrobacter sp. UBA3962]